jgi:hypothetical protein
VRNLITAVLENLGSTMIFFLIQMVTYVKATLTEDITQIHRGGSEAYIKVSGWPQGMVLPAEQTFLGYTVIATSIFYQNRKFKLNPM